MQQSTVDGGQISPDGQVSPEWIGSARSARLMAGLQAGILAGLMTALWFLLEAWRTGRPQWGALNLISTVVLGRSGYIFGFGFQSLVGLSVHIVAAGTYGVLFAWLIPERTRPFWAANAGLLFSFMVFLANFIWIFPRFAPIIYHRAARLEWAGAHFLAGMVLGLYPDMARGFLRASEPPAPEQIATPDTAPPDSAPPDTAPPSMGSAIENVRP